MLKAPSYLQEVNSDPIGFGEIIRAKHNWYWRAVEWDEVYKDINFNIKVDFKTELYGAIR